MLTFMRILEIAEGGRSAYHVLFMHSKKIKNANIKEKCSLFVIFSQIEAHKNNKMFVKLGNRRWSDITGKHRRPTDTVPG